jgi:DNA-binding MarR family transcriptional regulator
MPPPTRPRKSPNPDAVADRLHSAAIHILRRVRREDPGIGLSPPRASALSVIVFGGPITLGALAAAEQVRPPTMTHLVRALEEMGLVARVADPDDGRIVRIHATRHGKDLLEAGRARRVSVLSREMRTLSKRDLATLARASELLDKLSHD